MVMTWVSSFPAVITAATTVTWEDGSATVGFDESATHTINKDSVGVDFESFCERKIEINRILKISKNNNILLLKKCGFFYKNNYRFSKINDYIKFLFYSLIFRLRIIKRIMYKRL